MWRRYPKDFNGFTKIQVFKPKYLNLFMALKGLTLTIKRDLKSINKILEWQVFMIKDTFNHKNHNLHFKSLKFNFKLIEMKKMHCKSYFNSMLKRNIL